MSKKIKALIVDDYPDARKEIAEYLDVLKHSFEEAGSVKEARDKLAKTEFDYIVLDLQIPLKPGSPNTQVTFGKELMDEIIRDHPLVPILVVSGQGKDTQNIVEVMQRIYMGAKISFVAKPFAEKGNTRFTEQVKNLLSMIKQEPFQSAKVESSPAKRQKARKAGEDVIDLNCEPLNRQQFQIKINGQPVKIAKQQLKILACFGQAQCNCAQKDQRLLAHVDYDSFGIGSKGSDNDLASAFNKLKNRLKEHVAGDLIVSCGEGRWRLNAIIENLPMAEYWLQSGSSTQ